MAADGAGGGAHRRPGPVGRQLERLEAGELALPVVQVPSRAGPASCSRCQTAKSAYWTGSVGRAAARAAQRAAVQFGQLVDEHPTDQPSVMMWCWPEQQHVVVLGQPQQRDLVSGPRRRSNGTLQLARQRR